MATDILILNRIKWLLGLLASINACIAPATAASNRALALHLLSVSLGCPEKIKASHYYTDLSKTTYKLTGDDITFSVIITKIPDKYPGNQNTETRYRHLYAKWKRLEGAEVSQYDGRVVLSVKCRKLSDCFSDDDRGPSSEEDFFLCDSNTADNAVVAIKTLIGKN